MADQQRGRWHLLGALVCLGAAACSPAQGPVRLARAVAGEEIVPGRVLIELRPGLDLAAMTEAMAPPRPGLPPLGGVALRLVRPIYVGAQGGSTGSAGRGGRSDSAAPPDEDGGPPLVLADTGARDEAATRRDIALIAADPLVRRAEPDRVRRKCAMPNDPDFMYQWNLPAVQLPKAWDRTTGSANVVVAVLDTGVLPMHPDLMARLVPGYDFISDDDNADDNQPGRDPDPTDTGSLDPGSSGFHGTHVSGIIGAQTNNGAGIAGVDWACRLMPVRVLGVMQGTGSDSDIADAIRWAVGKTVGTMPVPKQAAQVLNMSFGGMGISFTVQRSVDEAVAAGAIVVAAAGNGNEDATDFSPGGLDGVISVGAAGRSGHRSSYSNYGPRVDLMAPGGDGEPYAGDQGFYPGGVVSTYTDGMGGYVYQTLEGTSQAAPHVSGAVALSRAIAPLQQLSTAALLRASADHGKRCDSDPNLGCGAGLLNVDEFLATVELQSGCRCSGDRYCLDGQCIMPTNPHPSIFADPIVYGGCSAGGGGGAGTVGMVLVGLLLGMIKRKA